MLDIYLIRHAHVDYGDGMPITPTNPLTPLGHEMARRLAARCSDWELQHLFVSTMPRAQQTADAISARHPALPRTDEQGLAELSIVDLRDFDGPLPRDDLKQWQPGHFSYGNARMWERVTDVFECIVDRALQTDLQRIGLVTHGGPLNVILRLFAGQGITEWFDCPFQMDWCGTACLRINREAHWGSHWIRWVNDARHIDELTPLGRMGTVNMTQVLLVRHSHVDYSSRTPITAYNPLTPLGHKLADRLAERLVTWDLEQLFVSTMVRAQQTADSISRRLPHLPRLNMPDIEETSISDMVGFSGPWPSEDLNTWTREHFCYADAQMARRVQAGWQRILEIVESRGLQRVALISHGAALNALIRHYLGGGPFRSDCWFEFDWTGITCLRYNDSTRSVGWINDARHIDDLRNELADFGRTT